MLFSFSPMAYGDVEPFEFNFGKVLGDGDFITYTSLVTPVLTFENGVTIDPASIAVVGSLAVSCIVNAGSVALSPLVSCQVITNDGYTLTRSGVVPISPVVPS